MNKLRIHTNCDKGDKSKHVTTGEINQSIVKNAKYLMLQKNVLKLCCVGKKPSEDSLKTLQKFVGFLRRKYWFLNT
ncbi:Hypothetical predicted protein [Octopus vulgaris]|uniref:Uncharacterized protein n=1 Tax=Octopus vulgaris TaxID=6645 RepID=A0AA36BBY4_OCTVU|nr:Hypothetical predicted protein [Octopus vulgaris]